MSENSKGILLFAQNNEQINYLKLAIVAAKCIKNNLGETTKISIVTDPTSINWLSAREKAIFEPLFDSVILQDPTSADNANTRTYRDTQYYSVQANFLNRSRSSAYELSPYDETILMDTDYFVLSDSLNRVWGNAEEVLINKRAKTLLHTDLVGPEFRLNPYGIRMYWATLIYFRKSEKAKMLFRLVDHIKECWDYYKHVYDFPGSLYRNDYAFSVAIHMLNGFADDGFAASDFPDESILTATDKDQFISFESKSSMKLFVNDHVETYKFYVSKIKDVNVHCLNKISIINKFDEIIGVIS